MTQNKKITSIILLSTLGSSVQAAELGRMITYSFLNEPLSALIELKANTDEIPTIKASIASERIYQNAGLRRPAFADAITLNVKSVKNGKVVLNLRTATPIDEPGATLIVELSFNEGTRVSQYALILDPRDADSQVREIKAPESQAAQVFENSDTFDQIAKPSLDRKEITSSTINDKVFSKELNKGTSSIKTEKFPNKPIINPNPKALDELNTEVKDKPTANPAEIISNNDQNTTVLKGMTLSALAKAYQAPGTSLDQTMIAFYKANPHAFIKNNINLLKANVILRIPTANEIKQIESGEARKQVQEMASNWKNWREKATVTAAQPIEKEPTVSQNSGKIKEIPVPTQAPDQLTLDKGKSKKDEKEVQVVQETKANAETNDRAAQLAKLRDDLQNLLNQEKQASLARQGKVIETPTPQATTEPVANSTTSTATAAPTAAVIPNDGSTGVSSAPAVKIPEEPKATTPENTTPPVATTDPKNDLTTAPVEQEDDLLQSTTGLVGLGLGALASLLLGVFGINFLRKRKQNDSKNTKTVPTTGTQSVGENISTIGAETLDPSADMPIAQSPLDEHLEAADTFMAFGNNDKALAELTLAMALDEMSPEVHIRFARAYAKMDQQTAFEEHFNQLRKITGQNGAIWQEVDRLRDQYFTPKDAFNPELAQMLSFDNNPENVFVQEPTMDKTSKNVLEKEKTTELPTHPSLNTVADPLPPVMEFNIPSMPSTSTNANTDANMMEFNIGSLNASNNMMDFNIGADTPKDNAMNMEFSSDLGALNLGLELPPINDDPDNGQYDTLIQLAKSYIEMQDRDGAKEILRDIVQKAQGKAKDTANDLLKTL